MRGSVRFVIGLVSAVVLLTACDPVDSALLPLATTTTVTATVTRIPGSPTPAAVDTAGSANEWTGGPDATGIFAVGTHPRDGLTAIPQGRYEVRVSPGAEGGDWMLCETALCGPKFEANAAVVGHVMAPYPSALYIGPRARTLWIDNLILAQSNAGTTAAGTSGR